MNSFVCPSQHLRHVHSGTSVEQILWQITRLNNELLRWKTSSLW